MSAARVVVALAATTLGCATGGAGAPVELADVLARGEPALGSGCAGARSGGLDADALGLAALTLVPGRGRDLAALAREGEGGAVELAPVDDAAAAVAEVTGPTVCAGLSWADLGAGGTPARVRSVAFTGAAAARMEAGRASVAAGQMPEARVAFAAARSLGGPASPAPGLAVARSYHLEERHDEAVAAYQDLVGAFPANPLAHAGHGDALRATGLRAQAAAAWARALALAAGTREGFAHAARDPFVELAPRVLPPALRVGPRRWIVRSAATPVAPETEAARQREAQAYAGCKERFRAGELRAPGVAADAPWRWSPYEESVCTAVLLRAYQAARAAGRIEDAGLDDLLLIARAGLLDERALFDVGAPAHPLAPALLDRASLDRYFAFVAAHRVMVRRSGGWLF